MFKLINIIFLLLPFISKGVWGQSGASYDNEKGTSMLPISYDLVDNIKAIEAENVEIVRIEMDLVFTSKECERILSSGYTYGAITYGDYRIKTLKLEVYKEEKGRWKFEGSGSLKSGVCSYYITPTETTNYKFKISVEEFNDGFEVGHYALILIHNL